MTLAEVQDVLHRTKGLVASFIQQTEASDPHFAVKGQSGASNIEGLKRTTHFRVWLSNGTDSAEGSGPRAGIALREAFEKLKLPLPEAFAPPAESGTGVSPASTEPSGETPEPQEAT